MVYRTRHFTSNGRVRSAADRFRILAEWPRRRYFCGRDWQECGELIGGGAGETGEGVFEPGPRVEAELVKLDRMASRRPLWSLPKKSQFLRLCGAPHKRN